MTYEVFGGEGLLKVPGVSASIGVGDRFRVSRGTPYQYIGQMSLLATSRPGLSPAFVTFDDQRLGRKEERSLRKMQRELVKEQVRTDARKTLTRWIGLRESQLAFLARVHDQ